MSTAIEVTAYRRVKHNFSLFKFSSHKLRHDVQARVSVKRKHF